MIFILKARQRRKTSAAAGYEYQFCLFIFVEIKSYFFLIIKRKCMKSYLMWFSNLRRQQQSIMINKALLACE